jgi:hypoxanthine phosphoribosyltransferase
LSSTKEKTCFKAVRRAVASVNSDITLKEKLDTIVRGTARSLSASASLVFLDTTGKKLVHVSSWALPQFYLRKGVLDADRSLSEVLGRQPVIIADVAGDSRIQYPEIATRAGIFSILGVPVMSGGSAVGSIRVYTRQRYDFTNQDISFVVTMSHMVAMALAQSRQPQDTGTQAMPLRQARSVIFANPSEEELARILDFYNIEWVYEPRSFPLRWEGDKVIEMFTPDFYLPGLDLYIEVTTLKQSLATRKNRKLRLLKQLYPEVKIMLLHKSEYALLLARYGCGPLAHTRARGISRVLYSSKQIEDKVGALARRISKDYGGRHPVIVGMQRGFICFMADLIRCITIPLDIDLITISYYRGSDHSSLKITKDLDLDIAGRHVILVEGVVDTGMTLISILNHLRARKPASLAVCTLLDKRARRIVDIPLDYVGCVIREEFVVGYGLDYREEYRNLPFIGVPELEKSR